MPVPCGLSWKPQRSASWLESASRTCAAFAELLATNRMEIVQPEYVELGGIHRLRQVAAIAESYQGMVAPHNARCPLSMAVNIQVDAATRNIFIQETFDDFHVTWVKDLFDAIPQTIDGYLRVSEGPGIGVSVNEALIDKYPPGHRNYMARHRKSCRF
jgi:galactonate dehydratase